MKRIKATKRMVVILLMTMLTLNPLWRICHPPAYSIGICNPVKMKLII